MSLSRPRLLDLMSGSLKRPLTLLCAPAGFGKTTLLSAWVNETVDRPAVGETRIRSGTKIDNLVQIAHGVTVGRNVLMAAQVGIAGSTVVGEGKTGAGFFVIESGEATVSVHGSERGKLGPGDYFGEIALIDEGARSATVTADSELRCYGLTSWEFRPLVEGNASIAWKLLETMAKRLRAAQS